MISNKLSHGIPPNLKQTATKHDKAETPDIILGKCLSFQDDTNFDAI